MSEHSNVTHTEAPKKSRYTVWAVALMTAAAVVSLRGLPMMAKEGLTMWFYIGFATLFFLIPGALVSAELGGMFNKDKGGVYTWVKEAFGAKWGFAAVWLQWIQNVVWYPVVLGFVAATLSKKTHTAPFNRPSGALRDTNTATMFSKISSLCRQSLCTMQ